MEQLLLHLIGDYVLQTDWMARTKTRASIATLVHVLVYVLPFLLLSPSPTAIAVIAGSHFLIDREPWSNLACIDATRFRRNKNDASKYHIAHQTVQFSTTNPGTSAKCATLSVITVSPSDSACAAISRS